MNTHHAFLEKVFSVRVFRSNLHGSNKTRAAKLALAAGTIVLNLVVLPSAFAADNRVTVEIANFTYSPKVVTVTPGTIVTWVNRDDIPHTVTATGGEIRSGALDTDETFTFTFTTPGAYAYFCSLHPHMTGKVVVKPAAGNADRY